IRDVGHQVEGPGQERVAGQDRDRLAEHLVRGRLAAPEVVVVHRRQVVVDERVRVDHLDGAGEGQELLRLSAHRLARGEDEHRPDPLAAGEEAVAHGPVDGRGPRALGGQGEGEGVLDDQAALLERVRRRHSSSGTNGSFRGRPWASGTRSPRASFMSSSILPSASSSLAWQWRESAMPSSYSLSDSSRGNSPFSSRWTISSRRPSAASKVGAGAPVLTGGFYRGRAPTRPCP